MAIKVEHFCTKCGKSIKKNAKRIKFEQSGKEITYVVCYNCKGVNVVEAWTEYTKGVKKTIAELRQVVVDKDTPTISKGIVAERILSLSDGLRNLTNFEIPGMKSVSRMAQSHNEARTERKRKQ